MSKTDALYTALLVDLRGHTSNERYFTYPDGSLRMRFLRHDLPNGAEVLSFAEYGFGSSCSKCGQYISPSVVAEDGNSASTSTKCPVIEDHLTTVTKLDFPSGKILVSDSVPGNWLRAHSAVLDGTASYNSMLGQQQFILNYAVHDTAYGPTGDEGLGLYKISDKHYQVTSPGYNDDSDDEIAEGESVASICTDLWAYSIVDLGKWMEMGNDPSTLDWTHTIVDILPGKYRFTYHGTSGQTHNAPHVYCDMEYLG